MPDNRYFYKGDLSKGTSISLCSAEQKHLLKVMRKKKGDSVTLINGQGILATGICEDKGSIFITDTFTEKKKKTFSLFLSLLRPKSIELVIEKATELGVDSIHLFPAKRSEKKELSLHQIGRLENILISALKQSGGLFLPKLVCHSSLLSSLSSAEGAIYFCSLQNGQKQILKEPYSSSLFIGPEKGWTEEEEVLFISKGATPFNLSQYTLRAETAAIAASSIFSFFLQEEAI